VPCARRDGYIKPKTYELCKSKNENDDAEDYVFCHTHRLKGESILANTRQTRALKNIKEPAIETY